MTWWEGLLVFLGLAIAGGLAGIFFIYLIIKRPSWIRLESGIVPVNLLVLVTIIIIILFPSSVLRPILSIPLLLFFPGYTLLVALFPKKQDLENTNRVVISFALSIVLVPLVGFILNYAPFGLIPNYTPLGINLESTLYLLASFIFTTSIIAWFRLRRLDKQERFVIKFKVTTPGWGKGTRDRVFAVILAFAICGLFAVLGYFVASPKLGETFTQFYLVSGETIDSVKELTVGESDKVNIAIVNHEGYQVSYIVETVIDNQKINEFGPINLSDGQKWEGEISFIPNVAGEDKKIELFLYKEDEVEPFIGPIYIWADISPR